MKKVFLIGDSIRLGYENPLRRLLEDEAQLYRADDNARFVQYTFRYAPVWANECCKPEEIDLVHWNNGLWDVLHQMNEDEPQTLLQDYRDCLHRIARRLRKLFPNALITFATTTSVIEERMKNGFYRRNAEIERYNAIAREVMAQEGIEIDELYQVARDMPDDWHAEDGTHYTPEGYQALAETVAAFVRARL